MTAPYAVLDVTKFIFTSCSNTGPHPQEADSCTQGPARPAAHPAPLCCAGCLSQCQGLFHARRHLQLPHRGTTPQQHINTHQHTSHRHSPSPGSPQWLPPSATRQPRLPTPLQPRPSPPPHPTRTPSTPTLLPPSCLPSRCSPSSFETTPLTARLPCRQGRSLPSLALCSWQRGPRVPCASTCFAASTCLWPGITAATSYQTSWTMAPSTRWYVDNEALQKLMICLHVDVVCTPPGFAAPVPSHPTCH